MNELEVNTLLDKYRTGTLSHDDWSALEQAIEHGYIDPYQIDELNALSKKLDQTPTIHASGELKHKILDLIESEKRSKAKVISINREWIIRAVLATAAMLTGLIIGFVLPSRNNQSKNDIVKLQDEMHSLKQTVMLTLLKDEAPSERLKAVSYTYELPAENKTVIKALLETVNNDNNINVRLAAVEALSQYGQDDWVREQLIRSIARQESPMVQVALAETMVTLKEKKSIDELQKLVNNKLTPEPVKKKLEGCIKQII